MNSGNLKTMKERLPLVDLRSSCQLQLNYNDLLDIDSVRLLIGKNSSLEHLSSLLLSGELSCLTSLIRSPRVHHHWAAHFTEALNALPTNLTNPPFVFPPPQTFWNSNSVINKAIYTVSLFSEYSLHSRTETWYPPEHPLPWKIYQRGAHLPLTPLFTSRSGARIGMAFGSPLVYSYLLPL